MPVRRAALLFVAGIGIGLVIAYVLAARRDGEGQMLVGVWEYVLRDPDRAGARAKMAETRSAGFDAVLLTSTWSPGQTRPPQELAELRNAAGAAEAEDLRAFVIVAHAGSRTTPITQKARREFADFAASLARSIPSLEDVVIGNESNLNRFWLSQFDEDGTDAAAPAYLALLAETYDALKGVSPDIDVISGALAPRGGDDPHSNYDKLVALLGEAFDGTAQRGSDLPILYMEFGVQSRIPAGKSEAYTNHDSPAARDAVPEATQARYYREALALASCQSTVDGLFVFHVWDEPDLAGWQSGLFYADHTPKSSLEKFRQAAEDTRAGTIADCD